MCAGTDGGAEVACACLSVSIVHSERCTTWHMHRTRVPHTRATVGCSLRARTRTTRSECERSSPDYAARSRPLQVSSSRSERERGRRADRAAKEVRVARPGARPARPECRFAVTAV